MATPFELFVNTELPIRQVLLKGVVNPSQSPGVAGTIGTYYKRMDNGDRYEKTGSSDMAWTLVASGGGTGAASSESVIGVRACAAGAAVGDYVWESATIANGVDVAINNTDDRMVMGLITEKVDATTAKVQFFGKVTGVSGLTKAGYAYIGTDGKLSASVPATGWVQIIGSAIDATAFDFNPGISRIKKAAVS